MARVFNFSAGPSTMPEEVLTRSSREMLEYEDCGHSVMEMSHRSPSFTAIIKNCEALLRELMCIPKNYKVLFLQGGASTQFSMVPLNLMTNHKQCDIINTGRWTELAMKEAEKVGKYHIIASSKETGFKSIPKFTVEDLSPDSDYLYICQNNTIYGTHYNSLPHLGDRVVVSDMSSCILSEPIDVSKYGVIFAGAQKNLGPAGLTIVIIREDLIGKADACVPTMLNYETHAKKDSMHNTPPTYSIYMCGLMLEWIKNTVGGVDKMHAINNKKAAMIYNYLDESKMFTPRVTDVESRSIMNIPFNSLNEELDKKFIAQAKENGIINIKGHKSIGGMRASIYNAMPLEGVKALVAFMSKFETENL